MPAPYPLIDKPPGDPKDIFDQQAMNMSIIHNAFIRGMNAIVAQARYIKESQVQAFVHFCYQLGEVLHHHHATEEEVYFPEIEKRLGLNTMGKNVDQHKTFLPFLYEYETYLKNIKEGKEKYDAEVLIAKLNAFTDPLMEHLHDEIPTLESSRLKAHFTKEELGEIDAMVHKKGVGESSLDGTLPMFFVCHDQTFSPWFNPIPRFIQILVRYWFYRKYRESWEFGPCDLWSRPRDKLKAQP